MTWKDQATPSGRRFCLLRASAHHHLGNLQRGIARWLLPAIGVVAMLVYASYAPHEAAALTIAIGAFVAVIYGIRKIVLAPWSGKKKKK